MSEQLWFLFALAGAGIGAVVQIIDMYLRQDEVFSHPIEPTIVSGTMQAMLWLSLPFVGFEYPSSGLVAGLAVIGGVLHIASLFFYFKVVFSFGDMSVISMLWNLLVAAVPMPVDRSELRLPASRSTAESYNPSCASAMDPRASR